MVLGGGIAYYFTLQGQRREKRIGDVFRRASGQSEAHMVIAAESALREMTKWLGCSRAVLAFWDSSSDYFVLCQYPPQRGPGDPPPVAFDSRQEWACFAGARLDFHAADVSLADESARKQAREYDLHPYAIQMLEIRNAVGCGLYYDGKPIGRLLLVNNAKGASAIQQARLREASHLFRDAVRHLLVVRRTEHEAYERERVRIAHDLHDGPLQSIISFEMRLNIIRKLRERDPAGAERELEALYELSRKLVSEMRTFVHRMRPVEGDESSLLAASRRLVESFQKETGIAVTLMAGPKRRAGRPEKRQDRSAQDRPRGLHNVYKHAGATPRSPRPREEEQRDPALGRRQRQRVSLRRQVRARRARRDEHRPTQHPPARARYGGHDDHRVQPRPRLEPARRRAAQRQLPRLSEGLS